MSIEERFKPAVLEPGGYLTRDSLTAFLSQIHPPGVMATRRSERLFSFLVRVAATPDIGPAIGSRCVRCGRSAETICTEGRASGKGGHIHEPAKVWIRMPDVIRHADQLMKADSPKGRPVIAEDIARLVKYCN